MAAQYLFGRSWFVVRPVSINYADRHLYTEARNGAALNDHIYMDAMGFGMGCCCLQLTFQSCNVQDARRMYDALIPVGPIMVNYYLA